MDNPPSISPERATLCPIGSLDSWGYRALLIGGTLALALAFLLGLLQADSLAYFFHSYLASYCFVLSISLGALFFVALQHITRAGWSVTVRRIAEILAANMPMLAILFVPLLLPVLLGSHSLYPWTDPAVMAQEPAWRHKALYLNAGFFAVRAAAYFAVWWWLARFFLARSTEQDQSGDPALTLRMERLSGPALLLFALTVTFAAFDWLMSLTPGWYSTIFGLYYYSGAVVGSLAAVILCALALQAGGRLTDAITVEHYHDLGKLLFAFVIFWGYMAFSQYLLIWYANIPEETSWYLTRQSGPWAAVSLLLWAGQLFIPFFGLLSRGAKRHKAVLGFWAAWCLLFHWIDLYWLVMPSLEYPRLPFGLIDVCLLAGLGALYLAGAVRVAGGRSLVPLRDPRLGEALAFENT